MPSIPFAARLLAGLALLLASQLSRAQGLPSYSPPPIPVPMAPLGNLNMGYTNPYYREGEGSYQTTDGDWHRAEKMRFDGNKLVARGSVATKLSIDKLCRLEIDLDTFLVLKTLPGRAAAAQKPEVLEVAYSHRGTQLLYLYYEYKVLYFLQHPGRSLQLLPSAKAEFAKAMLAIVQDCPEVATQVADGTLGRLEAVQIMRAYDACH
jgi:hypothetical protein